MEAKKEDFNWAPPPFKEGLTWCPKCETLDVKCVGAVPDGMNMNLAIDCQNTKCGFQWEQAS
jgi:hypothetical protein